MLEFGLASKRETTGRRGSGHGQEIDRQFHFGWVSLSTDGSTSLKTFIKLRGSTGSDIDFDIRPEANSSIVFFSRKKNGYG
jgi:hypothetical protein